MEMSSPSRHLSAEEIEQIRAKCPSLSEPWQAPSQALLRSMQGWLLRDSDVQRKMRRKEIEHGQAETENDPEF